MALDFVSMDLTSGLNDTGDHHMGLPNCRRMREELARRGAARPGAVFALSHVSTTAMPATRSSSGRPKVSS
jgi:hypothetical protein